MLLLVMLHLLVSSPFIVQSFSLEEDDDDILTITSFTETSQKEDVIKGGKWPNKTLYYAFAIDEYSTKHIANIERAIADLSAKTCVRFIKRTNETTYIKFRNIRKGCAATVGYAPVGTGIDVFLGGDACQKIGTIQHEILHSLGFWHEHTRPDRDKYITIVWDNIKQNKKTNFYERFIGDTDIMNLPYDYGSVMHYSALAFSKDGKSKTIIPKSKSALSIMGQRKRLSQIDVAKLNRLYDCPKPYFRGDEFLK